MLVLELKDSPIGSPSTDSTVIRTSLKHSSPCCILASIGRVCGCAENLSFEQQYASCTENQNIWESLTNKDLNPVNLDGKSEEPREDAKLKHNNKHNNKQPFEALSKLNHQDLSSSLILNDSGLTNEQRGALWNCECLYCQACRTNLSKQSWGSIDAVATRVETEVVVYEIGTMPVIGVGVLMGIQLPKLST
jgi:hypothetical protein